MKYRIEYESAKDGLAHTIDIEGNSPQDVEKKLVEKYKAEPTKILSCRRIEDSMKKYKIKDKMIEAKSPSHALKLYKMLDSKINDGHARIEKSHAEREARNHGYVSFRKMLQEWDLRITEQDSYNYYIEGNSQDIKDLLRGEFDDRRFSIYDSVKDDDISELTAEEQQAVEDYRKAIANTSDPKLLKVFAHILKEETDHLEELRSKEIEDEEVEDDRFSPMTYKKLKELGVKPEQWQKWTQEEANRFIASKRQKGSEKSSEKKEESKVSKETKKRITNQIMNSVKYLHEDNFWSDYDMNDVVQVAEELGYDVKPIKKHPNGRDIKYQLRKKTSEKSSEKDDDSILDKRQESELKDIIYSLNKKYLHRLVTGEWTHPRYQTESVEELQKAALDELMKKKSIDDINFELHYVTNKKVSK